MLLNYRTSIHSITRKSPALLFFGREIKNKVPMILVTKSPLHDEVEQNQQQKFRKSKQLMDERRGATESDIQVNDHVILKRVKQGTKFDSKYFKRHFRVACKQGALLILVDKHGNKLARNISYVKRVPNPNLVTKPISIETINNKSDTNPHRKQYPKCIRKTVCQ